MFMTQTPSCGVCWGLTDTRRATKILLGGYEWPVGDSRLERSYLSAPASPLVSCDCCHSPALCSAKWGDTWLSQGRLSGPPNMRYMLLTSHLTGSSFLAPTSLRSVIVPVDSAGLRGSGFVVRPRSECFSEVLPVERKQHISGRTDATLDMAMLHNASSRDAACSPRAGFSETSPLGLPLNRAGRHAGGAACRYVQADEKRPWSWCAMQQEVHIAYFFLKSAKMRSHHSKGIFGSAKGIFGSAKLFIIYGWNTYIIKFQKNKTEMMSLTVF